MPLIAIIIGVVIAALDQLFKFLVTAHLKPVGMQWIFVVLTVALLALLIIYMFKKRPKHKFFYFTSALIIGGGIGNLIDRVFYGYVIDYLSVSFFSPVCNFADYCITVGVVLLAIYLLFFTDAIKNDKKELKND